MATKVDLEATHWMYTYSYCRTGCSVYWSLPRAGRLATILPPTQRQYLLYGASEARGFESTGDVGAVWLLLARHQGYSWVGSD